MASSDPHNLITKADNLWSFFLSIPKNILINSIYFIHINPTFLMVSEQRLVSQGGMQIGEMLLSFTSKLVCIS